MQIDKLTREDIDNFTDEEVAFCYSQIQRQENIKKMKKEILNYIELQNVDNVRTIKLLDTN